MSIVDDVRIALQKFLLPDLRELQRRVESLETEFDKGFKDIQQSLERSIQDLDIRLAKIHARICQ